MENLRAAGRLPVTGRQSRPKLNLKWATVVGLAMVVAASSMAKGQAVPILKPGPNGGWCKTQQVFESHMRSLSLNPLTCAEFGPCDEPGNRDPQIPTAQTSFTTIRIRFHIVTMSDGSNPSTDINQIQQNVDKLNANYIPVKINFIYTVDTIRNSLYRSLPDSLMDSMKTHYAVQPDSQVNIYVSYVQGLYSFGTFPWDPNCLGKLGGIVMTTDHFRAISSALAHEMGHCLGLWHTFHGISEVPACSDCYEKVGATNHDFTGDWCSDTDPTPINYNCTPPPGVDTCSGLSWGPTDVQNYMGYSGDACWSEFSPQQMGRMHCWMNSVLSSWISNVQFVADTNFGHVPLTVNFSSASAKAVSAWSWQFGDGGTSSLQNPQHVYSLPGCYTVSLTISTPDGPFVSTHQSYVAVYADTITCARVHGLIGNSVAVQISARNYVPLQQLIFPMTWSGGAGLSFDSSSTAGLRTDSLATSEFINLDPQFLDRGTYRLGAGVGQNPLPAGQGPILTMYFTATGNPITNPVSFAPFSSGTSTFSPSFQAPQGTYSPAALDGAVVFCLAGDVNNDGHGPDLSDLTMLVSYLTGLNPSLPNPSNANVNGIGGIDLSDLTMLVSYLTRGTPPLICN